MIAAASASPRWRFGDGVFCFSLESPGVGVPGAARLGGLGFFFRFEGDMTGGRFSPKHDLESAEGPLESVRQG